MEKKSPEEDDPYSYHFGFTVGHMKSSVYTGFLNSTNEDDKTGCQKIT